MYETLKQALSFYGIPYEKPYFISLGRQVPKFPNKPYRIDFYAFCFCTHGQVTLEVNKQTYTLAANKFLLTAPSSTINFKEVSQDFGMHLLLFEKNFLLKNMSNPFLIEKYIPFKNGIHSFIETNAATIKNFLNMLTYLEEKSHSQGKFTDEIVRTIIFNILLEIAELSHQHETSVHEDQNALSNAYLAFRALVMKHILEDKSVQFYADKLNVANHYLIEIVKKASDKTPHQIIDEILLSEAYVLLGDTSLSISEIAFKLQFNSVSAFGRFFKKHAEISPTAYRTQENLVH